MSVSARTIGAALVALVALGVAATAVPAATGLSVAERATLLEMREEEKLAHDVYLALGSLTGLTLFDRIAASEARHGAAVERMLAAYGIDDPTDGYAVGAFPSQRFQALYDQLVARGSSSQAAALAVGVQIERLDVADLTAAIRETDEPALDRVYASLRSASEQHLRAFQAAQAGAPAGGRGAATGGGGGHWWAR